MFSKSRKRVLKDLKNRGFRNTFLIKGSKARVLSKAAEAGIDISKYNRFTHVADIWGDIIKKQNKEMKKFEKTKEKIEKENKLIGKQVNVFKKERRRMAEEARELSEKRKPLSKREREEKEKLIKKTLRVQEDLEEVLSKKGYALEDSDKVSRESLEKMTPDDINKEFVNTVETLKSYAPKRRVEIESMKLKEDLPRAAEEAGVVFGIERKHLIDLLKEKQKMLDKYGLEGLKFSRKLTNAELNNLIKWYDGVIQGEELKRKEAEERTKKLLNEVERVEKKGGSKREFDEIKNQLDDGLSPIFKAKKKDKRGKMEKKKKQAKKKNKK